MYLSDLICVLQEEYFIGVKHSSILKGAVEMQAFLYVEPQHSHFEREIPFSIHTNNCTQAHARTCAYRERERDRVPSVTLAGGCDAG